MRIVARIYINFNAVLNMFKYVAVLKKYFWGIIKLLAETQNT